MRTYPAMGPGARVRLHGCRLTFASAGLLMGAWTTTLPRLREQLGLNTADFGWLMLTFAVGGLTGLVGAPAVMRSVGARYALRIGVVLLLLAAWSVGAGGETGSVWVAAASILVFGLGFAVIDVSMNLQGSRVEHEIGRSALPGLNGMFSIGSVLGGLIGVAAVAWHVPAMAFLGSAAVLATAGFLASARSYAAAPTSRPRTTVGAGPRDARSLFQPRLIGLGAIVFVFCASEHTAFNWLIVTSQDVKGLSPTSATTMLTIFSISAVVARVLVAGRLVDTFGRPSVLALSGALAVAGTTTFVAASQDWIIVGVIAWGFGASLGFPLAVSAAGEGDARGTDVRVSTVSSFGYGAQFIVPPAVGLAGNQIGLGAAVLGAGCLVVIGIGLSQAAGRATDSRAAFECRAAE